MPRNTTVSIRGDQFLINGRPTYAGQSYQGHRVEGLLLNSRMVQGIFDDLNPATRAWWAYPDESFDAERNVREFVAAMPLWRRHGLLSFTINFQGGSPRGYSEAQPWENSAFAADGSLRPAYLDRLGRVLDRADELGMAPIVGYFYFGQEPRFVDEAAVVRASDAATDWLLDRGYANVLVEISNEADVHHYRHAIVKPPRAHELIERVRERSRGRLLVSTSFGGGSVPTENVLRAADFVLIHGNGVHDPSDLAALVDRTRAAPGYRGQPVVCNEDDHFDFDKPHNNFLAALSRYASWGYFDYRLKGETAHEEGYQSVPVDWRINSARKRGFFELLAKVTGAEEKDEG